MSTVLGFYRARLRKEGVTGGQSGAVVVVQRTSSNLELHPHLHVLFLDGAYAESESGVSFTELPRLSTHEVGEVLAHVVARIVKHLCRHGLLEALEGAGDGDGGDESDGLTALAASAASGRSPPAGPEWRRKATPLSPLAPAALRYDKPLGASQDGFTLHAATRAGAMDTVGRETLCRYVLRPPIAQERVTHGPDGLVWITLKRPFADGTVAVDMDPHSLLSRLATAVPAGVARLRVVAAGGEDPDAPRGHAGHVVREDVKERSVLDLDGVEREGIATVHLDQVGAFPSTFLPPSERERPSSLLPPSEGERPSTFAPPSDGDAPSIVRLA